MVNIYDAFLFAVTFQDGAIDAEELMEILSKVYGHGMCLFTQLVQY